MLFVDLYLFPLCVPSIKKPGKYMQIFNRRAAQNPVTSSRWKPGSVKPILITICFLKSPLLMASKILVPVIPPITFT